MIRISVYVSALVLLPAAAMANEDAFLAGDYNGNGVVEQGDLDLVLLNWGELIVPTTWINDLPIGPVDQGELDGLLLNWGKSAPSGNVPEPVSLFIAVVCLAGLGLLCMCARPAERQSAHL